MFDFMTLRVHSGAGEYVRRVYHALVKALEEDGVKDVKLYGLYDSSRGIAYGDIREGEVELLDAHGGELDKIVREKRIDRVFIGCAQYWGKIKGLRKIRCEVFCVVHDLGYEETACNKVNIFAHLDDRAIPSLYYAAKRYLRKNTALDLMKPFVSLSRSNPGFRFITVSEYSRASLQYNYGIDPELVTVLYSPEREVAPAARISNPTLRQVVEKGLPYDLLINADKPMKNAGKAVRVFGKFVERHKDRYIVTVGEIRRSVPNQIVLPFLSESDLEAAYRNCHAMIYPSFLEGFGYPPLEAMKFGKPILCSNVCSMPEILGDAPIYFSPLYETAIFKALCSLDEGNYAEYSRKSRERYRVVHERQEQDLGKLVRALTDGSS